MQEEGHSPAAWHPVQQEPPGLWMSVRAAAFGPTYYSGSGPSFLMGALGKAGRAAADACTPGPRRTASGELTGSQAAEQQQEQAGAGKEPERGQLSLASSGGRQRAARFSWEEQAIPLPEM